MIGTIVVGVDGSDNASRAVAFTAELGAQLGASVVAVHAYDPLGVLGTVEPPVDLVALRDAAERRLAEEWAAPLHARGLTVHCELVEDHPVPALVDAVNRHGADLVVVGARGRNRLEQLVLGSTSAALPHATHCPVVIVP
jgi:nucleotide-binding universal stress UspA family protein